jgi:hypothetical protein
MLQRNEPARDQRSSARQHAAFNEGHLFVVQQSSPKKTKKPPRRRKEL